MPAGKVWNVEWLNQNAQRNYPIAEGASMKDVTGTFELPADFIVDLVWPVQASANVQAGNFYVHTVTVFGEGVTITLGYQGLSSSTVGSVSVASGTHTQNQSYFINGVGDFFDSIGKITIGSLENISSSSGLYRFDLAGARLESTVVRPNLRGVSSIVLVNGSDTSDPLSGDIELIAGQNIRLTPIDDGLGNPQIRIDAIQGEGLNQGCDCSGELPASGEPIRTINGIAPDANGNFNLQGDDCLNLAAIENGLQITDSCSQACCGCTELEKIVEDLEKLRDQVNTLDKLMNRLDTSVNTAMVNLIASKTSNLTCGS